MDVERLQRRRAAARGWTTRAANALADLLQQLKSEDQDGVDLQTAVLDARRECEARLASLDEAQMTLECELDADSMESDLEAAWNFRDGIKKILLKAELACRPPVAAEPQEAASTASGQAREVRLPKLDLPKFSGNVIEWTSFWEAFSAAVDESNLPDCSKLTYLRSLLRAKLNDAWRAFPSMPRTMQLHVNF